MIELHITIIIIYVSPLSKKDNGFTLIELLVVIAIIGILATFVIQNLDSVRTNARNTVRNSDITQIVKSFAIFSSSAPYDLPSSGGTWRCLGKTSAETCWKGVFSGLDSLKSDLSQHMTGLKGDPLVLTGCVGGYIYSSNAQSTPGVGYGGNPPGAYISWAQENNGNTSTICGQGFIKNNNVCSGKLTQCMLYLGKPVL